MKKLRSILAVMLIISIMLSSVISINVSAEEIEYEEHISCVNEHFAWLQHENYYDTDERYPSNYVYN